MPWLLAMVATSTPAPLSARNAVGEARKVKSLLCGVPRVVIAVSRFTIARSARRSTAATGPKAVAGSRASRPPMTPSKWTSPPNARVTAAPLASPGLAGSLWGALVLAGAAGAAGARVVSGAMGVACWLVHAASATATSAASRAAVRREAGAGERDTAAPRFRALGKRPGRIALHARSRRVSRRPDREAIVRQSRPRGSAGPAGQRPALGQGPYGGSPSVGQGGLMIAPMTSLAIRAAAVSGVVTIRRQRLWRHRLRRLRALKRRARIVWSSEGCSVRAQR